MAYRGVFAAGTCINALPGQLLLHRSCVVQYYRVIALKLVDIVPSWDIERREL